MRNILYLFAAMMTLSLCTHGQLKESTSRSPGDTSVFQASHYINLKTITATQYLELLKKPNPKDTSLVNNLVTLTSGAPATWIKKEELINLIAMMDSHETAKCAVTAISSYLPLGDSATISGYAMDLIDVYRFKKTYPSFLASCPKTDKARKEEIIKWWTSYNATPHSF